MKFPLYSCNGIPINYHQGAFGFNRKHDIHTGVDLYCEANSQVYSMLDGIVVGLGRFTGKSVGLSWWNETDYIMIKTNIGIILYGEISINNLCIGDIVKEGQCIGTVIPVIPVEKIRSDVIGHSNYMLHMELYKDVTEPVIWQLNNVKPELLQDITPYIIAIGGFQII